jgi:hypothetical protein
MNITTFLQKANQKQDYWSLISFFCKNQNFVTSSFRFTNKHHIYPQCEFRSRSGREDIIPIFVKLPIKYHFLAHYYRAKEYEVHNEHTLAKMNYSSAWLIIGTTLRLEQNIPSDDFFEKIETARIKSVEYWKDSTRRYAKSIRGKNVYEKLGQEKAEKFLNKIRKPVICLETLEKFVSAKEAVLAFGDSNIPASCRQGGTKTVDRHFQWYDFTKPDNWYKEQLKLIKGKEANALKTSTQYPIRRVNDGKTWPSIKAWARDYGRSEGLLKKALKTRNGMLKNGEQYEIDKNAIYKPRKNLLS